MGVEGKILVEIYLPVSGESYDVFVYPKMLVHEMLSLLISVFTELSQGLYIGSKETLLCHRENGIPLDINLSAYENGLENGSQLMII